VFRLYERHKQLQLQQAKAKAAYKEYLKAYRRWVHSRFKGEFNDELEFKVNIYARKAYEAHYEAGRQFKVLRWWLNFGEYD
jgi:hypothetical protein